MRILFVVLLSLFIAASAALMVAHNPGYVLIAREPLVIETSLAVFVILMAVLFVALYAGARFAIRLVSAPRDLSRWRRARRTRKAREAFHQGLVLLLAGEWLKAEQSLLASLHAADSPFLGHLAVALAAHGQHDLAKRDRYLAMAHERAGEQSTAAELLQVRLQLATGELEPAHAALVRLHERAPNQSEIARLLLQVYRELHDWQALLQLIPEARRRHLVPEAELAAHELAARRALLDLDLPRNSLATLQKAWRAVPEALREHPDLAAAYARQLIRQDAGDEAAALIAATLDRHWNESLALLYGEIASSPADAQLANAEEWLARQGDSAALLLTLGRLAQRAGQTDRAQLYLERSLQLGKDAAAHAALARLLEARGDKDGALDHYRTALETAPRSGGDSSPAGSAGAPLPAGTHYGY